MLLELAGELAPAVISDMLGLNPTTAVRWARAAAGDWNAYAAQRAFLSLAPTGCYPRHLGVRARGNGGYQNLLGKNLGK
jgi:hypothetical protein